MYITDIPLGGTQGNLFNSLLLKHSNIENKDETMVFTGGIITTFAVDHDPKNVLNGLIELYTNKVAGDSLKVLETFLTHKLNNITNPVELDSIIDDFSALVDMTENDPIMKKKIDKFIGIIKEDVHLFDEYDMELIEKSDIEEFGLYHYISSTGVIVTSSKEISAIIGDMEKFAMYETNVDIELHKFYSDNSEKFLNIDKKYVLCLENNIITKILNIRNDVYTRVY